MLNFHVAGASNNGFTLNTDLCSPRDFWTSFFSYYWTESNEILTVNVKPRKCCHCAVIFSEIFQKMYSSLTIDIRTQKIFECKIFTILRSKFRAWWQSQESKENFDRNFFNNGRENWSKSTHYKNCITKKENKTLRSTNAEI